MTEPNDRWKSLLKTKVIVKYDSSGEIDIMNIFDKEVKILSYEKHHHPDYEREGIITISYNFKDVLFSLTYRFGSCSGCDDFQYIGYDEFKESLKAIYDLIDNID
jgi:hypothetical protein